MNDKPKQYKKRPAALRIALWVFAGAASFALLVLIVILCLPTLVSTAWFTQIIEQQATLALNRTVSIDRVSWKWSDSFRIEGIRLPDDPLFSHQPLMTVDSVNLEIQYVEVFSKRIHADLAIDGLTLRIIRNTAGASNVEHLLSPLATGDAASAPPPPVKKTVQIPVLPLDLQLGLKLTDTSLFMDDRKTGKKVALQRTALEFNLFSLSRGRVNLDFAGDVSVDGTRMPRSHLRLATDKLFTPKGALNITDAVAELDARLPGIQVHVEKPEGLAGLDSSLKIDLATLFDLAGTLSPSSLPVSDLKGLVEINLKGSGNPRTTVRFDSRIKARDVELTGTRTGGETVGPLKLAFRQTGQLVFENSTLILETGFLHILDNSRFQWQGRLNGFDRKGRDFQFQLNLASHLDLEELAQAAKPLWKDVLGEARLQGSLSLDVETSGNALPEAVYDLTVEGQEIRVAGGPIKNTAIGPVVFTLSQKGSVNLPGENLVIESGNLTFMQENSVAWKGRVDGFKGKVEALNCDAELQTKLDLPSLLQILQPLIPAAISGTGIKGQVALEALVSGRPWGGAAIRHAC